MGEMVALSKKWYKDKVVELQTENKQLKEAMKEIAKSPQWRRVPNWVIIKIEQALKGGK